MIRKRTQTTLVERKLKTQLFVTKHVVLCFKKKNKRGKILFQVKLHSKAKSTVSFCECVTEFAVYMAILYVKIINVLAHLQRGKKQKLFIGDTFIREINCINYKSVQ